MLFNKLKAGALQLTLFIMVVIAVLLTMFLLFVNGHKKFSIQSGFTVDAIQESDAIIAHAFHNTLPLGDTVMVRETDENRQTLLQRSYWGVFEKIYAQSRIKHAKGRKMALVGGVQPENNRLALYLQENRKPLVVVGNTRIEGLVYLPKQGIKPGTIAGHSYYGGQLVYGARRESETLPVLDAQMLSALRGQQQNIEKTAGGLLLEIVPGKHYANSFYNPVQYVLNNGVMVLNAMELIGNIVLISNTKIVIEASSKLHDVILIAPEIDIKNGVKGRFQAIASQHIKVGEEVALEYPSALVLNESLNTIGEQVVTIAPDSAPIDFGKHSSIKGQVIYIGAPKHNNYKVQLKLREASQVYGEVYCNQNLELLGSVKGSVFTNNFVARQSGSIYQNHIYNGQIEVLKLPQEYVGIALPSAEKGVMTWLY